MTSPWPTDEQVVANAQTAYAEIRTQIDHQLRNAESIDTKATAVITAVGVLAALVAPRLHLDSAARQVPGIIALVLGFAALACCFLAIRPQATFAYGADPEDLMRDRIAERFPPAAYTLGVVQALVAARRQNVIALNRKGDWYALALLAVGLLLVAIGWLIYAGGIS